MPSVSEKERRYMGKQLAKQVSTGSNATGMSASQLRDFARKPVKRRAPRRAVSR